MRVALLLTCEEEEIVEPTGSNSTGILACTSILSCTVGACPRVVKVNLAESAR